MTHAFLIARQEFIKYVTRRGFWLSILMFPLWIMVVILIPKWTGAADGMKPHVLTVVDRGGGAWRDAIFCAAERAYRRKKLDALAAYAATNADGRALARAAPRVAAILRDPAAPGALAGFEALDTGAPNASAGQTAAALPCRKGGTDAVAAAIARAARPNAPGFSAPEPDVSYIDAPDYLAGAAPPDFAAASRRALAQEAAPGVDGGRPLDTVIVLPAGFGAGGNAKVQIWADQQPEEPLRDFVSDALTGALRLQAVRAYAPQITDPAMLDESVELESRDPARAGARDTVADAIVPIALAVILFVVSVMNSSVLLQGVVEEKSTRMIEVLLSCATPREITSGKLIGVIAVALATLAIWAIAFFALISLVSQDTATLVLTALKSAASIDALPLLLVYFLCGLLIYGSLFLAIGSMAASLADAQSLLGPSMLILMLPNLLIGPVIRDPNGPLATAFSWIPIYTPFFMMLRIASHPPSWQLWGTAALAIATTAGMIVWTGRIFARHVLTTERPPSVAKLVAGLMGRRSR